MVSSEPESYQPTKSLHGTESGRAIGPLNLRWTLAPGGKPLQIAAGTEGEQLGQPGVIWHGPPQTNIDWPYGPAACRAPIDPGCPIAIHEAGERASGAEETAHRGGSPPHRKGKNLAPQFVAEAAGTSEALIDVS